MERSPSVTPRGPRRLVVALDGPGSSGKSSVGAAAALELAYRFCDTGLLYRAVTWLAIRRRGPVDDPVALLPLVGDVELAPDEFGRLDRVLVDGHDVTGDVRTPEVDERVSEVARVAELRAALLPRQRALAHAAAADGAGIIMAGRDIGTVVLPDADLKIYLDASVEERARRRTEERKLDPRGAEARWILADLRRRDGIDGSRAVAPLRAAQDAIVILTDGNRFDQTVALVVAEIRAAELELAGRRTAGRRAGRRAAPGAAR